MATKEVFTQKLILAIFIALAVALGLAFQTDVDPAQAWFQSPVPPVNDDFDSATVIAALPFSGAQDISGATIEPDEPQYCNSSERTVWYVFTPEADIVVGADTEGSDFFDNQLTIYEVVGPGFGGLSFLNCAWSGSPVIFLARAGTTYYIQAGGVFGSSGSLQVNLTEAVPPLPEVFFFFDPFGPSAFDTIQFYDYSYDPAGIGIESQAWDFGDGATATGCCPTHRYAADGDYTVQLMVTTFDGRSAATSQVVQVRTHDVAITKFKAPKSASAGQTRQIVVGINSKRQTENVRVELHKSVPGGFQFVGFLDQSVPVRPANRTTDFNFSYTFTPDDASVGKVTFKAIAFPLDARDALPADNEAIAAPTKVNR